MEPSMDATNNLEGGKWTVIREAAQCWMAGKEN